MIWYRVGSRNEELGQTGKSHFLEHMLFKGTDRFKKGEIDLLTLKNGGSNNAFTSQDFTAYYFQFRFGPLEYRSGHRSGSYGELHFRARGI